MAKDCNCGDRDPVDLLTATASFWAWPNKRHIDHKFHVPRGEVRLIPSKKALNKISTDAICYPVSGCEVIFAGESSNGDTWDPR